ncbi:MAG: 1-(5-phosphoribosyl)-5-[(5-phosphoribosylamino)methylideneamino]imidazole-4-carboxamide isomerase [Methanohalobium sp.]|uniref:1-(5-phosphoribosyl)-5-[(5- phosphoribosylamino)methylideneamino]imidazole-4- carboxamide isomerase n=1 Tax=Methanohalobium sp. TaxID=2837493 RepID=UPI00397C6DDC
MCFEVIPAIDIREDKCVQLVQGIPGSEIVCLDDPLEVAVDWWNKGARIFHIIDLDGAIEGKRKNAPIIQKIVDKFRSEDVIIQVGGGIRSEEDAAQLLNLGVDRVILSTAALENPDLVKQLSERFGSKHLMVALDSKKGKISVEGWTKESEFTAVEMGIKFENMGAGSILFTNIDTEGLMQGTETKPVEELVKSVTIPVIASGGVTSIDDIRAIKEIGASGVVVGSALYKNKFKLADAIDVVKGENCK